jgi:hypothetical protein
MPVFPVAPRSFDYGGKTDPADVRSQFGTAVRLRLEGQAGIPFRCQRVVARIHCRAACQLCEHGIERERLRRQHFARIEHDAKCLPLAKIPASQPSTASAKTTRKGLSAVNV